MLFFTHNIFTISIIAKIARLALKRVHQDLKAWHGVVDSTEYTQSTTASFLHTLMEKFTQAGEGGGARPPPFTIFIITYKVAVYAPAEWSLGLVSFLTFSLTKKKAWLYNAVPAAAALPTQRTQQRRQILHDLPSQVRIN